MDVHAKVKGEIGAMHRFSAKVARALVVSGSVVLLTSAVLHCVAGYKTGFPALSASNLAPRLQTAFRVVFLAGAWHSVVFVIVALLAAFTHTSLRKILVLFCGLAVLLEAAVGAGMMGLFIGNEVIGAGALLFVCAGLLFDDQEFKRSCPPRVAERPEDSASS